MWNEFLMQICFVLVVDLVSVMELKFLYSQPYEQEPRISSIKMYANKKMGLVGKHLCRKEQAEFPCSMYFLLLMFFRGELVLVVSLGMFFSNKDGRGHTTQRHPN